MSLAYDLGGLGNLTSFGISTAGVFGNSVSKANTWIGKLTSKETKGNICSI